MKEKFKLSEVIDLGLGLMWWQGFKPNVIVMPNHLIDKARKEVGMPPSEKKVDNGWVLTTIRGVPILPGDEPELLTELFPKGHDYNLERSEIWIVDCRYYNKLEKYKAHNDLGLLRFTFLKVIDYV